MFLTSLFRLISGDDFFEYLVGVHLDFIKNLVFKMLQDRALTEDIMHEVLIKLNKYRHRLKNMDEPAVRSSIYRTVQSVISNYFRSQHKEAPFLEEQYAVPPFTDDIDNKVTVDSLLSRLTSKQRDLLIYRYFMGYSHEEIAAVMHLNPKNVNTYLQRAKKAALKLWKARNDIEQEN